MRSYPDLSLRDISDDAAYDTLCRVAAELIAILRHCKEHGVSDDENILNSLCKVYEKLHAYEQRTGRSPCAKPTFIDEEWQPSE